jgi:hypothetical protein
MGCIGFCTRFVVVIAILIGVLSWYGQVPPSYILFTLVTAPSGLITSSLPDITQGAKFIQLSKSFCFDY